MDQTALRDIDAAQLTDTQRAPTIENSLQKRALPQIPGPSWLVAYRLGRDLVGAPIRYFDEYGDTFAANVLGDHYVMTRDPAWINEVLLPKSDSFIKDRVTRSVAKLVGNGLLTNDSASWSPHRKLMQPHFRPAEAERAMLPMKRESEIAIEGWAAGEHIELQSAMVGVTLRAALRSLFGADPEDVADLGPATRAAMDYYCGVAGTMMALPTWIPTAANRGFVQARAQLVRAMSSIIASARRLQASDTPLGQLLLAQAEGRLSEEEMLDEAMTMLLVGHDPSAQTLAFTLAVLAQHPAEQEKVAEELRETGVPTTFKALTAPSALRDALSESLRLYPASWAMGREARHDVEILGTVIKKGTQLTLHQWAAHRHPRWFEAPDEFRPSRWQAGFATTLPKGLYIPWGGGPRVCIGNHFSFAQMLVSLGVILSKFRLQMLSPFPPRFQISVTARAKDPILVKLEKR
jgi:cytochrome P450